MKIVFMGTPDFAVPSLKALLDAGYSIPLVVTVADKPAGRGLKMTESPVKKFALENNLRVLQPLKLKDPLFIQELEACNADLFVVVAFKMLPEVVWRLPPKGTINLHASLLPNYRGAAPINWAIIHGETVTGLTTFFIEKEIDTGAVIGRKSIPILPDMTAGQLHDSMLLPGAELILESVKQIEDGKINPIPQIHQTIHHPAPKLTPEICRIDWNQHVTDIYNLIRGLSPYPGAWTTFDGKKLKIFESVFSPNTTITYYSDVPVGSFVIDKNRLLVKCANDYLSLTELQLEGKKRMSVEAFVSGLRVKNGLFI